MNAYWVTFRNRVPGCVEAESIEKVYPQAQKHGDIATVMILPYPAEPRLSEKHSEVPSFCIEPKKCQGRTSCPRRYACTE